MPKLWALLGIVLLAGAACSKSTDTGGTVASPPASAMASESPSAAMSAPVKLSGTVNNHGTKALTGMTAAIELEQDNFYFNPTFLKADKGAHVTVEVKNEGNVPHNFSIDSLHVNQTVEPGKTAKVTVSLPATSAPVAFYCKFHKSQGMQGAFYH
jgi:plastocyanin